MSLTSGNCHSNIVVDFSSLTSYQCAIQSCLAKNQVHIYIFRLTLCTFLTQASDIKSHSAVVFKVAATSRAPVFILRNHCSNPTHDSNSSMRRSAGLKSMLSTNVAMDFITRTGTMLRLQAVLRPIYSESR